MKKGFAFIALLFPSMLLAEASIGSDKPSQTFLLKAPGTVTGIESAPPTLSPGEAPRFKTTLQPPPLRYKPPFPDNRVDSYRFPQYGQAISRHNPWDAREKQRRLPPPLPPANPFAENPWDLSGRLPAQSNMGFKPEAPAFPSYYSSGAYGFDALGSPQGLYPDYPDAIYRDANPAAIPFRHGVLPGLDDRGFDFPFMPFNMF
jgi:hypothetical protein